MLLAACTKPTDDFQPKPDNDGTNFTNFTYNPEFAVGNAVTLPNPTGDAMNTAFPDTALAVWKRFSGEGLQSGGVELRSACDGYDIGEHYSRVQADWFQAVAVLQNPANPFATISQTITMSFWRNDADGKYEIAILWDSLRITRQEVFCGNQPSNSTPAVLWGLEVDQLTGVTKDTWRMFWNQTSALGFSTPLKAIVIPRNVTKAKLWQLPQVKPVHLGSILAQEATEDLHGATGWQPMAAYHPCFSLNGFAVQAMEQDSLLTLTANGPLGLQSVQFSSRPDPLDSTFVTIPQFIKIGTESYAAGTIKTSSSTLTSVVWTWGFKPNGGSGSTDTNCFKR
jgi:hypothetical protein